MYPWNGETTHGVYFRCRVTEIPQDARTQSDARQPTENTTEHLRRTDKTANSSSLEETANVAKIGCYTVSTTYRKITLQTASCTHSFTGWIYRHLDSPTVHVLRSVQDIYNICGTYRYRGSPPFQEPRPTGLCYIRDFLTAILKRHQSRTCRDSGRHSLYICRNDFL